MNQNQAKGVSLIELMVAITISSFLMLSFIAIAMTNKRTFTINEDLHLMQENARFVFQYMARQIYQAGFRSPPNAADLEAFTDVSTVFTGANQFVDGAYQTGNNTSDSLIIRYQGSGDGAGTADNTIRDCDGNGIDADVISTDTFTINNSLQLVCNNTTVIDGVERMTVLYGEDLTGDRNANRYVRSNFVGLTWDNVVSIRVALLMRTTNEVGEITDTNSYDMLGSTYNPADDRRVRRLFTTTFQLRNLDSSGAVE